MTKFDWSKATKKPIDYELSHLKGSYTPRKRLNTKKKAPYKPEPKYKEALNRVLGRLNLPLV